MNTRVCLLTVISFLQVTYAQQGVTTNGVNTECLYPPDRRQCGSNIRMYYFDEASGRCKYFFWGGCLWGSMNRFSTLQECNRQCACHLAFNEGGGNGPKCEMEVIKYFYNKNTELCQQFTYMGCGGNGNNFATNGECLSNCKPLVEMEMTVDVSGVGDVPIAMFGGGAMGGMGMTGGGGYGGQQMGGLNMRGGFQGGRMNGGFNGRGGRMGGFDYYYDYPMNGGGQTQTF
ncbi:hypothetical protein CHS0354_042696 [Potamilus streckersoni]|uniref:BPTI/Kunitz inhibitor domain-containing protein n=1 Tax=Potamilus streckersoni TaxID=2493646 RepID=A0AAE0S9D5_9BIVA|nr:hypothetical protein CHS0354_042696 [Potamilus streckersoni]